MRTKILITEPEFFPADGIKELEMIGEVVARRMNRQELLKNIADIDILIIRIDTRVDKEIIDCAKKLKIIATPITGTNHIDVEYAETRGIIVLNAPGFNSNTTAEHAFALIISLSKRILSAFEHVKSNKWNRHEYINSELRGKTLGIIGLGRIGSKIAEFAKTFDMKTIAYDKYVSAEEGQKRGAEMVELNELLKRADIISLNCILTDETKNMISYEQFRMMKKGALLINTARGLVVNEAALIDALSTGKITGAAIDVMIQEPPEKNNALIEYAKTHENLIITPHVAGFSYESILEANTFIIEKIKEELKK